MSEAPTGDDGSLSGAGRAILQARLEREQALLRELSRRTEHAKLSLQARRSSRSWSDLTRGSAYS